MRFRFIRNHGLQIAQQQYEGHMAESHNPTQLQPNPISYNGGRISGGRVGDTKLSKLMFIRLKQN